MYTSKSRLRRSVKLMLAALSALASLTFSTGAFADPNSPPTGGQGWAPPIKPASDAGEKAIQNFKIAPGLKVSLWAAEPMLCNPNALCTDEHGNLYVAETNRYHGGVIDIRGAMNWLDEDIASRTVADRLAMIKKHENEGPGREAMHSPNSERIIKLQDTTGSGRADKATVFADGFSEPADGLGSGILARKGTVYYTCIPSLYALRDTKNVGRADQKVVLSTGYGVRYAFLGHDLHGLVFGPDGKLYFSIGDRGANVEWTPDNRHVENIEAGGVFRCNPDGTGLEVFATGLRNPQELRFDQFGNLFTGDNNPDKGDPARWVYVVEDGDSGWRESYQYAERLQNGGPWMAEEIWNGEEYNNAHYINPCVQPLGAGPSGLVYYPGTGLPERYANHFFLCDFRGGPGNSGIWSLVNKPHGASFELIGDDGKPVPQGDLEHHNLIYHILATDCEYGVDGGLYISDWINGWDRPNAGRIYHLYDDQLRNDPLVLDTKKLIAEGMDGRPEAELLKLLVHADLRIRQEAQFALADKGAASVPGLTAVALRGESLLPRLHAIWGLGEIAGREKAPAAGAAGPATLASLPPLLDDKEPEVRCQAAKVLGDGKVAAAVPGLLKLLHDGNLRVRYFATMALGKIGDKSAVAPIFAVVKENADNDATLRFGCVDALAKLDDEKALIAAGKDESPSVRLAAALALRRLASPKVAEYLRDSDRSVVLEAARAINDLPIEEALPQLAALLDKPAVGNGQRGFSEKDFGSNGPRGTGDASTWVLWRAVNANFRLGSPEAAKRLAAFAARGDAPAKLRVEALKDLAAWGKPSQRDGVTNLYRPLPARDPAIARAAAKPVVGDIARNAPNAVRIAATNVMHELGVGDPASLSAMVGDSTLDPNVRAAALESLAGAKDEQRLNDAVKVAMKDKNPILRRAAITALGSQPDAAEHLKQTLDSGTVSDKQAALTALGGSKDPAADAVLSQWMDKLLAKQVEPELRLDLLDAAAEHKSPDLAAKLKKYDESRDPKDGLKDYRECETGGDADAGRKIFREKAEVSCIRCHTAEGLGGIVGPRLDGIGAKQTREYLLESIVLPNAKIAPGFETVVVTTKENKYRVGVMKRETDKELELLNPDLEPDKQRIIIPKDDIKTRDRGPSAMPEGLVKGLKKRELRDLIEYLASLKTEPKQDSLKHGT